MGISITPLQLILNSYLLVLSSLLFRVFTYYQRTIRPAKPE